MKVLATLLLLCSVADAQVVWQSVTPTQCGGCCHGGSCSMPQYYPPRTLPTVPPRQQRPQPDGEFTEPAPQFQPLPSPPQPTTPPQAQQPTQPAFDWDEYDKRQAKLLEAIAANKCECKPCECKPTDLTPVIKKLDALIAAQNKPTQPTPTPAASPKSEQHVVVVADHNAPYWERLARYLADTRKTYSGVQDTTLPPFGIGIHPQAVVYRNSVPVRVVKGQYEVEALLSRLARNEPI